jgi:uncharacterized phage-associated protein
MPLRGYSVKKAAQVVAFFAYRAGGEINILRVSKLIYLSDREFLSQYDVPILYDRLVSMPHGPVTSVTLNYINGLFEDSVDWDVYLAGRAGHFIGLARREMTIDDLDQLSRAEIEVLERVWSRHKHRTPYELRDYTHEHCLEWEDPHGSSLPIPYERVFKFLNKHNSEELAGAIEEDRALLSVPL